MRKNETNSLLKMYEKFVNSIISNIITYWLAAGFIEDEPKLLTCSIIQGCSSIESVLYLCCRYHKETLAPQKFYQQAVVARIFKLAPSKSHGVDYQTVFGPLHSTLSVLLNFAVDNKQCVSGFRIVILQNQQLTKLFLKQGPNN